MLLFHLFLTDSYLSHMGGRFAEFVNKVHLSFSLTHNLELVTILLKARLYPEMDLIFLLVNMKVVNDCENYGHCFSNIDTSSQFFTST